MCRLLETIRITDGQAENLLYHQRRVQRSSLELFRQDLSPSLATVICCPKELTGIVKCRIIWAYEILSVAYESYSLHPVRSLKLVYDDSIEYPHKFLDRTRLENLKSGTGTDEILIVKNGLITDTSFSNIIFSDGSSWYTPAVPILAGTKRAKLLENGFIKPVNILPADLDKFAEARLINAMLDPFDSLPINPAEIIR